LIRSYWNWCWCCRLKLSFLGCCWCCEGGGGRLMGPKTPPCCSRCWTRKMGYPVMTGCPQSRCRTGLSILSEHYPLRLDPASTWARTLIPCRKAFVQNFCLRWQPSPGRWPSVAGFLYFPPKKTIFSYKLVSRFYFYLIIHFFYSKRLCTKGFRIKRKRTLYYNGIRSQSENQR